MNIAEVIILTLCFRSFSASPGKCKVEKSCHCSQVPAVNITSFMYGDMYGDPDASDTVTSLNSIKKWNSQTIIRACKRAKCDIESLSYTATCLQIDVNVTEEEMTAIKASKRNIQFAIDCHLNKGTRDLLFDRYGNLTKRHVILGIAFRDLNVKMKILHQEVQRCLKRSWVRQTLENIWHKGWHPDPQTNEVTNPKNAYICQDHSYLLICPPQHRIVIQDAMYGRIESCVGRCAPVKPPTQRCSSNISLERTRELCDWKENCNLTPSNDIYGNPCPGVLKYLKVQYTCLKNEQRAIRIGERSTNLRVKSVFDRTSYKIQGLREPLYDEETWIRG